MRFGKFIRVLMIAVTASAMSSGATGPCRLQAAAEGPRVRIGDITRVQGLGVNTIIGMGLVTGLKATGDGPKCLPTMMALHKELSFFAAPVESLDDIKDARNVAIVEVSVEIPEHGAREGDRLDVHVTALAAKSLVGGQLLVTPLVYDDPSVSVLFAKASGRIEVEDPAIPTRGIIRGGARMEQDVLHNVVVTGDQLLRSGITNSWIKPDRRYVTFVLIGAHAGWNRAAAVASAISKDVLTRLSRGGEADHHASGDDDEFDGIDNRGALALDSKSILVLVPRCEYTDPATFIRDIAQITLAMESNEARVTINRKLRTIVISGDVYIAPTIVSHAGLMLTVGDPQADGNPGTSSTSSQTFVPLQDPASGPANMAGLLEALNRLKVPFESRVDILTTLQQSGALQAKVVYEG